MLINLLIINFLLFFAVRTIEVEGVEGNRISLPCPLAAPSKDKVYMVLWFRDDAGIPLYRYVLEILQITTEESVMKILPRSGIQDIVSIIS